MNSLFNIFKKLKREPPKIGDGFAIKSLPQIKYHKIGITQDNQPIFFIKCEEGKTAKTIDINLEFISVQFNRKCQLVDHKNKIEEGVYTIISLKSDTEYLQEYFLKMVYVLINNISAKPHLKDLKIEIDKIVNLFSRFSQPALKTIQGLWAELLVIQQSINPDYLINSWHSSKSATFDFNDGIDKIEVKSTTKNRRLHNFSLNQLNPNLGSKLIIASVYTVETGVGTNVFDLIDLIESKLKNKKTVFRLNELTALTLGKDFDKSYDVFFDYQYAVDSIKYFNSIDIPTICASSIPSNIINVKFDCDITDLKSIRKGDLNSKLLNSLF